MNRLTQAVGRWLPRRWRNQLKSPARTLRWWRKSRQPDQDYSPVGAGCHFRCPPLAVEYAFQHQFNDPEQAVEFADFLELLRPLPAPLFFDLGAHFGLFSHVVLAKGGPSARAVAVDPSGTACSMIRHIAAINGWTDRLEVIQGAMGGTLGEVEMVDGGVMLAGYFMAAADQPAGDRVRVPRLTIDELVRRVGGRPDLIKIDIESFEQEVFDGAAATLTGASISLCLEVHNRYIRDAGKDPKVVLQKLSALGYTRWTMGTRTVSAEEILKPDLVRIVARRGDSVV